MDKFVVTQLSANDVMLVNMLFGGKASSPYLLKEMETVWAYASQL